MAGGGFGRVVNNGGDNLAAGLIATSKSISNS